MRKAEEELEKYYKEMKSLGNPKYEQKKKEKESYEKIKKEEEEKQKEKRQEKEVERKEQEEKGRNVKRKTEEGKQEGKEEKWGKETNCLIMITDSRSLASVMCGHDELKDSSLHKTLSATMQRLEVALNHGWRINDVGGDPWIWRPREQNKAPDSICNYVMDHKCDFIQVDLDATRFRVRPNIYVSSDGGCRVEEGISATGWVIRAVGENSVGDTVLLDVAKGGTFINRTCSSFQVEAYAMSEVMQYLLKCFNIN